MSSDSPIPFTAILAYSQAYNVEDFEEFLYLIRVLDNIFLEHHSKKKPPLPPPPGKK